jgi:hypothetical protein
MPSKPCTSCGLTKPLSEFYPRADRPGGRRSVCRECEIARVKAHNSARKPGTLAAARRAKRDSYKEQTRAGEARVRHRQRSTLEGYLAQAAAVKRKVCKREQMDCELTGEFLLDLFGKQNGRCALSGRELVWGPGAREPDTLSIDRIDRAKGYTLANIRLVTCQVNMARGILDDASLVALARDIVSVAGLDSPHPTAPVRIDAIRYPLRHYFEPSETLHYRVHDECPGVFAENKHYPARSCLIDAIRNGRRVRLKARVVDVPSRLAPRMESLSLPRVQVCD